MAPATKLDGDEQTSKLKHLQCPGLIACKILTNRLNQVGSVFSLITETKKNTIKQLSGPEQNEGAVKA